MSSLDQDALPPDPGADGTKKQDEILAFDAEARNERWLKVSIGLGRFEKSMWPLVLQLGRLDTRLSQADEVWPDRFSGPGLRLGKRIVNRLYPPLANFIATLRDQYGQYWLQVPAH